MGMAGRGLLGDFPTATPMTAAEATDEDGDWIPVIEEAAGL